MNLVLSMEISKMGYSYLTVQTEAEIMKMRLTRIWRKDLQTHTDLVMPTLTNFVWCCEKLSYTYEWIVRWRKFSKTSSLPKKKNFYSNLTKYYRCWLRTHKDSIRTLSKKKNLSKCLDLFVQNNTLLRAAVFASFCHKSFVVYELDLTQSLLVSG